MLITYRRPTYETEQDPSVQFAGVVAACKPNFIFVFQNNNTGRLVVNVPRNRYVRLDRIVKTSALPFAGTNLVSIGRPPVMDWVSRDDTRIPTWDSGGLDPLVQVKGVIPPTVSGVNLRSLFRFHRSIHSNPFLVDL